MTIREDILLTWLAAFRCNVGEEGSWWWPKPVCAELERRGWIAFHSEDGGDTGSSEMTDAGEAQVGMFAPEMGIAPFEEMMA